MKTVKKTTKVTILYREYEGGGRMLRTIVNGNKTNTEDKEFEPIKKWLARDYFEEMFYRK
jgi:hypothetical protein